MSKFSVFRLERQISTPNLVPIFFQVSSIPSLKSDSGVIFFISPSHSEYKSIKFLLFSTPSRISSMKDAFFFFWSGSNTKYYIKWSRNTDPFQRTDDRLKTSRLKNLCSMRIIYIFLLHDPFILLQNYLRILESVNKGRLEDTSYLR